MADDDDDDDDDEEETPEEPPVVVPPVITAEQVASLVASAASTTTCICKISEDFTRFTDAWVDYLVNETELSKIQLEVAKKSLEIMSRPAPVISPLPDPVVPPPIIP